MAFPSQEADRANLRFPEGLRERLKQEAAKSGRSMNSEIMHRLEASFEASRTIHSELARLIDQHIEAEISARLRKIAASIGGGA